MECVRCGVLNAMMLMTMLSADGYGYGDDLRVFEMMVAAC